MAKPKVIAKDLDTLEARLRFGLGFDPLVELVKLYREADSIKDKMRIATDLLSYVAPKQGTVKHESDVSDVIEVNIVSSTSDEAATIRQRIKDKINGDLVEE